MYELVSEINVKAPVATVRAILTDFGSYPKWTGAARVAEEASDRTKITYVIRLRFKDGPEKSWPFSGQLTINPPGLLGWRLGLPGLLGIEMRYAFAWTNGATHVHHLVRFSGVLAGLGKNRFKRIFQPVMDRTLNDLAVRARHPLRISSHRRSRKK
ncbi:MAG: SRPBCC family protein [Phenylobacterium sp.]|uniref:SRPBCC family protein n=1 Tax=Phenylobacterium sp. TaxID=1871053 RepID=UPI00272747CA|nr:SRPBCC family protein [Phenylobacterium sp.]MDO8411055.1 SRPBCC family protein [Phenylobacterium sp.]